MGEHFINAAKDGYLDLLRDASKRDLNGSDEDGMTATMWAAHNGHIEALRLIVGRGGEVDKKDYLGLTSLHHAARRGLINIVTFLVNWGANVYSLDNDFHSALDWAALYEKTEVVNFLDGVISQQEIKNPKYVARMKEEAIRLAQRNRKRYEKLQEEANRRAQKEQRKLTSGVSPELGGDSQSAGQRKQNFFKTLTMRIRGSNQQMNPSLSSRTYSAMAGVEGHSKVAQRTDQHQTGDENESNRGADFKISDVDGSGKRVLHSFPVTQAVPGTSSEVMYLTSKRGDSTFSEVSSSRPAVYEVFSGSDQLALYRTKSESDILDSDPNFDNQERNENTAGIFNRPGFGKTAFLTGSSFLNTLPSFESQSVSDNTESKVESNVFPSRIMISESVNHKSVLEGLDLETQTALDLSWDQEEADNLDEEEEGIGTSALEMFLWSAGLESYLLSFLKEKIDMELLGNMSDSELQQIGLPFGPRKRVLDAVKKRNDVLRIPKEMRDSFF